VLNLALKGSMTAATRISPAMWVLGQDH
jgi:hypothetical protein